MNGKLRNYIEFIFEDAPRTKEVSELKEEMLQNLIDKYNDLVAEGKSSEAAYNIATASIGDVNELIEQLKNRTPKYENYENDMIKRKKQSALFISVAVMLYILSVVPVILIGSIGDGILGVSLMFVMIAIATGLLIYNFVSKPKYLKDDEELKESIIEKDPTFKSISSSMWLIITIVYLIISFITSAWYITWIIFLIGAVIQNIIKAVFELKK